MKALEWYDAGTKAIDPIEKFTNFWRGFNYLFFRECGRDERRKIRSFLGRMLDETAAQKLLALHETQIDYLLSQPVVDMRGNGKDTRKNIDAFNSATSSMRKVEESFMVIYQVRCNLEHGQKSPSSARDVRLCECAAPIVAQVIHDYA